MNQRIEEKTGRLRYFDALRGFSMIFVVFSHVMVLSMGLTDVKDSMVNWVIMTFRMPLFFFVSGFFAYRVCTRWTASLVGDVIKRKIQAQIIGTIVFYSLFLFCHDQEVFYWLHGGFGAYWFTITLFQMFMIFLALSLLSRLFCSEHVLDIGLLLVSSIYFLSFGMPAIKEFQASPLGNILSCEHVITYFQFFALGIFCRKYWNKSAYLLTKNWLKTSSIVIFAACLIVIKSNSYFQIFPPPILSKSVGILVRYAGLMVVVSFFFNKEKYFNEGHLTGSLLEYIGRRTLDIYLLHYFFLPNLKFLQPFLTTGNTVIIQLFIGITVSAAIITLCLLISNVLRSSNFLASWLFGVKPPPK
ncbi:acyltransferase [uncultured Akkermansia sp.]|uniref:acyltransferase family protein n=1 Tax=uncultured Akkermansia sp. TaxID=512294 RepID=UPI00262204E1|nr:acyltransferase [uncultured Akkermansia sp.]